MNKAIFAIILSFLVSSMALAQNKKVLANEILQDKSLIKVDQMARAVVRKGFRAGAGYKQVWARDGNTFIELACEEYNLDTIRNNILMFFHFQQENGEMLDGYIERKGFHGGDPHTYESESVPIDALGFKNTVETDQETSLVQLIAKYVEKTRDWSILAEVVAGKTVYQRLAFSLEYLLIERYSPKYKLITGATTFDWGDVQVEGGAVVDVDELTHWCIDVYDNAMMVIALNNMEQLAPEKNEKKKWGELSNNFKKNIRKHLWDKDKMKFIPHIYLDGSPFPDDFDENEIHYHGGTAVAIEAGILSKKEILEVVSQMKINVELSGAQTIGLTVYPTYPAEVLGKNICGPYIYQNGGDWTWFGGRMIQQLIAYGFVEEAYVLAKPMFKRVLDNDGFYEWYKVDGTPTGSPEFKGSAGVLWKAIEMFKQWAHGQVE